MTKFDAHIKRSEEELLESHLIFGVKRKLKGSFLLAIMPFTVKNLAQWLIFAITNKMNKMAKRLSSPLVKLIAAR